MSGVTNGLCFLFFCLVDVVFAKHLEQRTHRLLNDARSERILHVVLRYESAEGILTTHLAKFQVTLPGELVIFAVEVEELEGHDLGKGVVDVIERGIEDMPLREPATSLGHIGVVLIACALIGRVLLLESRPFRIALIGSRLGMEVDPMLELVHRHAIRQEGDGVREVHVAVAFRILEEEIHVGMGEEFH